MFETISNRVEHYWVGFALAILMASWVFTSVLDTMNLLILFVLIAIFLGKGSLKFTPSLRNWLVIVFLGFFVLGLFHLVFHPVGPSVWLPAIDERIAAVIASLGLVLLLLRTQPKEQVVWLSVVGAGIGLMLTFGLEWYRVGDVGLSADYRFGDVYGTSFLVFGVVSSLMTALFFAGFTWAIIHRRWGLSGLFLVFIVIALMGTFLSGTRGAWLGLPEILLGWALFGYFTFLKHKGLGVKLAVLGAVVLVIVFLSAVVSEKIEFRAKAAVTDVEQYFVGNPNTSIGLRLVMYEAALNSIKEKPISGVGFYRVGPEIINRTQEVFKERFRLDMSGFDSWDVHNQYLQEAMARGIPGLIGLLWIQVFALVYFIRSMHSRNIWAVAGTIFVIASAINMMSYSWLRFHDGMFFYFMILTLFIYGSEVYGGVHNALRERGGLR